MVAELHYLIYLMLTLITRLDSTLGACSIKCDAGNRGERTLVQKGKTMKPKGSVACGKYRNVDIVNTPREKSQALYSAYMNSKTETFEINGNRCTSSCL